MTQPVQCFHHHFTDGGRTEVPCLEIATLVCKVCNRGTCDEHEDLLSIDPETLLCEDCE